MLKRFFFLLIFTAMMLTANSSVFAAAHDEKINKILPPSVVAPTDTSTGGKSLPTENLATETVPRAIKIFLMFVGSISAIVFVYAGIMLIIAQGNEEEITKFKNILIWSAVGLVFITTAYAIVRGVMGLLFE